MLENDPGDSQIQSLLLADTFQSGVCLGCGGRAGLYVVLGRYVSICAQCVANKIEGLRSRTKELPKWVDQLEREVRREIIQIAKRERQKLQVAFSDFYRCAQCGKLIQQKDARYPLGHAGSAVPPHCATCFEFANQPDDLLKGELARRLVEYSHTSDERMVAAISTLYKRVADRVPKAARMQMLFTFVGFVEEQRLSGHVLVPFIFNDPDPQLISTAALHLAGVYPGIDRDSMIGVRELAGHARAFARDGDEARSAAILGGLVSLGDHRVFESLGPCWRTLSSDGRQQLAESVVGRTHAGLIEWLISWLEECEGDEFGCVARTLAHIPAITRGEELRWAGVPADSVANQPEMERPAEVIEVRRAFPVWSAPPDEVITILKRIPFSTFSERIRPRLLQIAADEQRPRVMHDVLKQWGIDHSQRQLAGVAMRAQRALHTPRPLLPLVNGAPTTHSYLLEQAVPLTDVGADCNVPLSPVEMSHL